MKLLKSGRPLILATAAVFLLSASVSKADFIDNGAFDTDLSGWDVDGDIGTTWIAGTAHLGRPGTPGTSIFSQTFTIDAGTTSINSSFSYMWQIDKPALTDTFRAYIVYNQAAGGTGQIELLTQGSDVVPGSDFDNTTFTVSSSALLTDLLDGDDNATIFFSLVETNTPQGTRIQLDDVSVAAVPIPAAAWLFGSALLGLGLVKRKKA